MTQTVISIYLQKISEKKNIEKANNKEKNSPLLYFSSFEGRMIAKIVKFEEVISNSCEMEKNKIYQEQLSKFCPIHDKWWLLKASLDHPYIFIYNPNLCCREKNRRSIYPNFWHEIIKRKFPWRKILVWKSTQSASHWGGCRSIVRRYKKYPLIPSRKTDVSSYSYNCPNTLTAPYISKMISKDKQFVNWEKMIKRKELC